MSANVLNRDEIRTILSLYHLDGLEDFGVSEGSHEHSYWVRVAGRRYALRLTARRRFKDMVFEKDLLAHLRKGSLPVPRVIQNVASGAFTPWSVRGRYVSLFEDIPGRRLGIFELRARHVRSVGDFLARMHQATIGFAPTRGNEFSLEHLEQKLERIKATVERRRLSRRFAEDLVLLTDELEIQKGRTPEGPSGIVHGDLFVKSAKFNGDRLVGVFDFDYACHERLTWDLSVALNAWCWEPSSRQMGGPSGKFSGPKVKALLGAYISVRQLSLQEKKELEPDLRLVALRFALTRLIEFELARSVTRPYRDYRHFLARLMRLREGAVDLAAMA